MFGTFLQKGYECSTANHGGYHNEIREATTWIVAKWG